MADSLNIRNEEMFLQYFLVIVENIEDMFPEYITWTLIKKIKCSITHGYVTRRKRFNKCYHLQHTTYDNKYKKISIMLIKK